MTDGPGDVALSGRGFLAVEKGCICILPVIVLVLNTVR